MPAIHAYGEFWDPDLVIWGKKGRGNRGSMLGDANGVSVDVWDQLGIYVLHHDWSTVYVGRVTAESRAIGARLREHRADRLAGRWDRFSWYGLLAINKDGSLRKLPKRGDSTAKELITTLEAMLLGVTSPPLNRSATNLPGAKRVVQQGAAAPRPLTASIRAIEERLDAIARRLDELHP